MWVRHQCPGFLRNQSSTYCRVGKRGCPHAILKTSWLEVSMNMKIVLDDQVTERSVRADLAWELFFNSKTEMPKGHGEPLLPFANWFWDEMGQRAGRLLKYRRRRQRSQSLPWLLKPWTSLCAWHRSGPMRSI